MRVGIHQPNFVPHFGFFYKMSMCDVFVLLSEVQFEKNGYQNRYFIQRTQRWVTMPVKGGLDPIHAKRYVNGLSLDDTNTRFIMWVKDVLSIDCRIVPDVPSNNSKTARLIDNLNHYGATAYVTNPTAKDKYLDEKAILEAGIDIIHASHPLAHLNILEMFEEHGIEGTRDYLYKRPANPALCDGSQPNKEEENS